MNRINVAVATTMAGITLTSVFLNKYRLETSKVHKSETILNLKSKNGTEMNLKCRETSITRMDCKKDRQQK